MNSQDFLIVNIAGATAFVLWYALARNANRRPTRLDMKAKDSAPSLLNSEKESEAFEAAALETEAFGMNSPGGEGERASALTSAPVSNSAASAGEASRTAGKKDYSAKVLHPDFSRARAQTKTLNVMFNYNGHSWDAYEVLGVPAGSSVKAVTDAYQAALRRCDKNSVEFLETAYKAILNKGS